MRAEPRARKIESMHDQCVKSIKPGRRDQAAPHANAQSRCTRMNKAMHAVASAIAAATQLYELQ
jgi:hypothetical protein